MNEAILMQIESNNEDGQYGEEAKSIIDILLGMVRYMNHQACPVCGATLFMSGLMELGDDESEDHDCSMSR